MHTQLFLLPHLFRLPLRHCGRRILHFHFALYPTLSTLLLVLCRDWCLLRKAHFHHCPTRCQTQTALSSALLHLNFFLLYPHRILLPGLLLKHNPHHRPGRNRPHARRNVCPPENALRNPACWVRYRRIRYLARSHLSANGSLLINPQQQQAHLRDLPRGREAGRETETRLARIRACPAHTRRIYPH